jgi:hypothetical protein
MASRWSSIFNLAERPSAADARKVYIGLDEKSEGTDRQLYRLLVDLEPGFVLYRIGLKDETERDLKENKNHFGTHPGFCFNASYIRYGQGRELKNFNTAPPNGPHKFWKITLTNGCKQDSKLYHFMSEWNLSIMRSKFLDPAVRLRPVCDKYYRDGFIRPNPYGPGYLCDASHHIVGTVPEDAKVEAFEDPEACFDLHFGMMEQWPTEYPIDSHTNGWCGAITRARLAGKMPLAFETNEELALKEAQWISAVLYKLDVQADDAGTFMRETIEQAVFLPQWGADPARDARFASGKPVESAHGYYTDAFCRILVETCPALQLTDAFGAVFRDLFAAAPVPFRTKRIVRCNTAAEYQEALQTASDDNPKLLCDFDTVYKSNILVNDSGEHDVEGFADMVKSHAFGQFTGGIRVDTDLLPEIKSRAACMVLRALIADPTLFEQEGYSFDVLDGFDFAGCSFAERLGAYQAAPTRPVLEMGNVGAKIDEMTASNEGLGLVLTVHGTGGLDVLHERVLDKIETRTLTIEDSEAYFDSIVIMPVAQAASSAEPLINVLQVPLKIFKQRCEYLIDRIPDADVKSAWIEGFTAAKKKWSCRNVVRALRAGGAPAGPHHIL